MFAEVLPPPPLGVLAVLAYAELARRICFWIARRFVDDRPAEFEVVARDRTADYVGEGKLIRLLSPIPGNQSDRIEANRKTLQLDRWSDGWGDLSIVHASDLHLSGRIARPFYEMVVARTMALRGDVIIISGDIVESQSCVAWVRETLGQLSAPLGVYYLLGNHDVRMRPTEELRELLDSIGWIDVGGKTVEVDQGPAPFVIFGNERPWFPDLPSPPDPDDRLRIGVVHTPDQHRWAMREHADLILAGHTHGGQIRIPILGPLICPSLYDVWFASGVFQRGGATMHVSRGVAAFHPIRLWCSPEVTRIELCRRGAT
ncbi:MAG: metallophosphoesterase [Pirellulaceae bacterium]|nr:metallophosphoesterase [Pirellulaceae bacterium]MDP7017068.1 metallophosphoesterase [Pirellulaceae bacterium]